MKPLSILLSILFFFQLQAQESTNHINDSIINWSTNQSLSWDDFNGELEPTFYAAAMTTTSIDILPKDVMVDENDKIQGSEKLTCVARFHRNHSWTNSNNQDMLDHEQLHFDIAEIFARKLRKKFDELKSVKEARFTVYLEASQSNLKKCRRFQMQYDKLTNHGRDLETNKKWQQMIRSELAKKD